MHTEPLIEIRDLQRRVVARERPLLEIAGFSIDHGDRIALQGKSGSGKSSLLRAIALLDPWANGELRYRAKLISAASVTTYRREVIYLPQRPALIPGTVRDNLRLPFQLSQATRAFEESKVVALLDQLGQPASLLDQPSDALSGGERQFVALVRAIQLDPRVLLLDEPTASLDAESAGKLEAALMRWHGETNQGAAGRAFVLASHHTEQIKRLSDRTVVIEDGSIREANTYV